MSMLTPFLNILDGWSDAFAQERVFKRAVRHAISSLCVSRRNTISQAICFAGRSQQDWASDYRFFSSREWDLDHIFQPIIETSLELIKQPVITVAFDDTRVKKTGKKIPGARWHRDPLSPPFQANLMWGLRYLQASILLPLHQSKDPTTARAIPVRFEDVPHIKKPGKKATPEDMANYRSETKKHNLSTFFVDCARGLRTAIDQGGGRQKPMLIVADGSFCNKTVFQADFENVDILARTRKDAKLCYKDESGIKQRFYSPEKFTPDQVRQDDDIPWQTETLFYGGRFREMRYKKVPNVLWQRGGRQRFLTLFVLAPTRYNAGKGKFYYRDPAYLLATTDQLSAKTQLQAYFDRWEIEVNFRDEKTILGLGQAQVRNAKSVQRQPAFLVASYATLLLAGQIAFGNKRTQDYYKLPKWRRNAKRPSCLDLLRRLRHEIGQADDIKADFHFNSAA